MGEANVEECSAKKCVQITPETYRVKQFKLTDIPGVMDGLQWKTAARLMRFWFAGEQYIKNSTQGPPRVFDDLDIETLSASANRLESALQDIQESLAAVQEFDGFVGRTKNWPDELSPGLIVLMARLELLGALSFDKKTLKDQVFDYSGRKAAELDKLTQFNRVKLGSTMLEQASDPLDDLYGSFGAFTVNMAAIDMKTHSQHLLGYPAIEISTVGLYLHDSYDFVNDGAKDQRLGLWSERGVLKRWWDSDYVDDEGTRYFRVSNNSFNKYRAKWKRGGDFMVYSTIRKISVDIMIHLSSIDFDEAKARKAAFNM